MKLPQILEDAIEQLRKIPGVGHKTATRQALTLSYWSAAELAQFGESFKRLADLKKCDLCGMYAMEKICHICSSDRVQNGLMCVVETVIDCMAIEKSEHYRGTYHLLGGVLNPLMGIGPAELEMERLFWRIEEEKVNNVILAINPSVEGDATCAYIRQQVGKNVNVDRIGFGVPIGGHLEYLDAMTITKAMENRTRMQ